MHRPHITTDQISNSLYAVSAQTFARRLLLLRLRLIVQIKTIFSARDFYTQRTKSMFVTPKTKPRYMCIGDRANEDDRRQKGIGRRSAFQATRMR